jgi:hypothetical protein
MGIYGPEALHSMKASLSTPVLPTNTLSSCLEQKLPSPLLKEMEVLPFKSDKWRYVTF